MEASDRCSPFINNFTYHLAAYRGQIPEIV